MQPSLKRLEIVPYDLETLTHVDAEALEKLSPASDYMKPRPMARRLFDAPADRTRVLLVESDTYNRRLLRVLLSHPRLSVIEVEDGEAAIDLLALRAFDIVLLSLDLPRMTGAETIGWIRGSQTPWADIPIFGLVEADFDMGLGRYWMLGLTDWTRKPIDRHDLMHKLLKLMPGLHDAGL